MAENLDLTQRMQGENCRQCRAALTAQLEAWRPVVEAARALISAKLVISIFEAGGHTEIEIGDWEQQYGVLSDAVTALAAAPVEVEDA